MPVHPCTRDGLPGAQWGNSGHCYTYGVDGEVGSRGAAVRQAIAQATAAGATAAEKEVIGFTDILGVSVSLEGTGV